MNLQKHSFECVECERNIHADDEEGEWVKADEAQTAIDARLSYEAERDRVIIELRGMIKDLANRLNGRCDHREWALLVEKYPDLERLMK